MQQIQLEPVDALSITILMDNSTDVLLMSDGPARRPLRRDQPTARVSTLDGGEGPDVFKAEHGFSALVTVTKAGATHRILFDTGVTQNGMVDNMRRLQLSPAEIETIVLSHGHFDHTSGMDGLARELGPTNLPVLIHPEFWSRRRIVLPGVETYELPTTSRGALEGVGFQIVEERQPSFLLDGALLVTGEIDRTTEFEQGFSVHEAHRSGGWEPDPLILDDQALVARIDGGGLVVLTGCGHAGIVNTLRHVRRLTGETDLHAVIGGFHLTGPMFEPIIEPTCAAFAELDPDYLVPAHCTGWRATHRLAAMFPDAFLQSSVGTTFEFGAVG